VTAQDAQTIDSALYQTLVKYQNEYWRARDGSHIGSRHQTMGTSAFHTGVRLLLRRGAPDEKARQQLEAWRTQGEAYFANATKTFHDDLEGIPSYHSFQPVANEALRSGVASYFGGNLDWAVQRALAVTDNLGFYAGTGTYEEARPGTLRTGIMLGYPLAMAAMLRQDAGYEWLLHHHIPTNTSATTNTKATVFASTRMGEPSFPTESRPHQRRDCTRGRRGVSSEADAAEERT
jgi:hypothetical protein